MFILSHINSKIVYIHSQTLPNLCIFSSYLSHVGKREFQPKKKIKGPNDSTLKKKMFLLIKKLPYCISHCKNGLKLN